MVFQPSKKIHIVWAFVLLTFSFQQSEGQHFMGAFFKKRAAADPCSVSPTPGTVCTGGAIFLGTLSPGATSGSGTDKYMTTPGGCGEIPAGQIGGGSANSAWPNADFTTTCPGTTDVVYKNWNNGTTTWYNIPALTDYGGTVGYGNSGINLDADYGSVATTTLAGITSGAQGGPHVAAMYCEKLNYGGYTDWYLPNRQELHLIIANQASIGGITASNYWSSTEKSNVYAWIESNTGYQSDDPKNDNVFVRCVRRF